MNIFQHLIIILIFVEIYCEFINNEIENIAVTKLREYLRIRTDHPKPDYVSAIEWLRTLCLEIGLEYKLLQFEKPEQFVVIMTWRGSNSKLKSILLNSHIDVVEAYKEKWTYPPFDAVKINGNIYGRGIQDDKAIGIEYLYAIKNLKDKKFVPLRDIHVSFVPGEEIPGGGGMKSFTKSKEFQKMNIGVGLDEGCPGEENYFVFYSDKVTWKLKLSANGTSGHGASLPDDTAINKITRAANKILAMRQSEFKRMDKYDLWLGEVNTINLNILNCGVKDNIIPPECFAIYDIRLSPLIDGNMKTFDAQISQICKEEEIEYSYLEKSDAFFVTFLNDSNVWWKCLKESFDSMNLTVLSAIMPGRTDAIYTRKMGIPVFEFTPMKGIPALAHAEDEYIPESVFLNGIKIYENIIQKFFSLQKVQSDSLI